MRFSEAFGSAFLSSLSSYWQSSYDWQSFDFRQSSEYEVIDNDISNIDITKILISLGLVLTSTTTSFITGTALMSLRKHIKKLEEKDERICVSLKSSALKISITLFSVGLSYFPVIYGLKANCPIIPLTFGPLGWGLSYFSDIFFTRPTRTVEV